jgi:hypothetical protein
MYEVLYVTKKLHTEKLKESTLYTDIKTENMNKSETYSNATIPMPEICTTNNSCGTPTGNIPPLPPYK